MCSFGSCQTRFEFLSQFRKVRNAFECFVTQVQTHLPKTKRVWPMKINVICTVGRLPIEYNVNSRLLGCWYKLICGSDNKLSCIFYKLIYSLHVNQVYTTDWLENIRIILAKCNLTEFWLNQQKVKALSFNSFKRLYKEKLKKLYVDKWLVDVQNSRKCCLYKNIKFELKLEDYLVTLIEPVRSNLIRLRLSNHKMPIETGRHIGIDRNDRLCNICKSSDIGDEYHYFCICPVFKSYIQ